MRESGCIIVLVVLLAHTEGSNSGQSLRLHLVNYTLKGACAGGDVGLTKTSIVAEYRLSVTKEWKFLAEIDPKAGFNGILKLPFLESPVEGVQFRLLQLEHGGGGCNCWRVEEALLMWGGNNRSIIKQTHCSKMPPSQTQFCGGSASSPRGFVSRTVRQGSGRGLSVMKCPRNSTLVSSKGSPLPQHCSATTQRMYV